MSASRRVIVVVLLGWIGLNALAIPLLGRSLPFHWADQDGASPGRTLLDSNLAVLETFLLIALIVWLTRGRPVAQPADIGIARPAAARELAWLAVYGLLVQVAGMVLARAMDWQQFSFHVGGTLHGAHDADLVGRAEILTWAAFNLCGYVIVPHLVIGRRHESSTLWLRSRDRRGDTTLVLAVLGIECVVQFAAINSALFDLSGNQIVRGVPLSFALFFLGTVLPTMIFVQALILPRILVVTGSIPWTVVLGGFAYTLAHLFDAWTMFDSPRGFALSCVFLMLGYMGPGMVKAVLTLRTQNVWVHAWAYHAIAPHTIIDTPLIVRVFRI